MNKIQQKSSYQLSNVCLWWWSHFSVKRLLKSRLCDFKVNFLINGTVLIFFTV